MIEKINETTVSSLKRQTKLTNFFLRSGRRERAHINKIRNKREITTDAKEIQRS